MTTRPTDEQRAEWRLQLDRVTEMHSGYNTAATALIDAIFAAGVDAAQAGMKPEMRIKAGERILHRRVTGWQAADDA